MAGPPYRVSPCWGLVMSTPRAGAFGLVMTHVHPRYALGGGGGPQSYEKETSLFKL